MRWNCNARGNMLMGRIMNTSMFTCCLKVNVHERVWKITDNVPRKCTRLPQGAVLDENYLETVITYWHILFSLFAKISYHACPFLSTAKFQPYPNQRISRSNVSFSNTVVIRLGTMTASLGSWPIHVAFSNPCDFKCCFVMQKQSTSCERQCPPNFRH